MRTSEIVRDTNETKIKLSLSLDGSGKRDINTGVGFLDHMLELFAAHGHFDLSVKCNGDLHVDAHHTVEDVGITLGKALDAALGNKNGIARYGSFTLPMDEALVMSSIDVSGRQHLSYELSLESKSVGNMDTELIHEFFLGFTRGSNITLHIKQLAGANTHHIVEAAFKSVARALKQAVKIEGTGIPSTKGII